MRRLRSYGRRPNVTTTRPMSARGTRSLATLIPLASQAPGAGNLVWLNLRAAPSMCSPERANDHLVVVERVVEVERRPPEVHATDAADW